jgi:hypothetical protein
VLYNWDLSDGTMVAEYASERQDGGRHLLCLSLALQSDQTVINNIVCLKAHAILTGAQDCAIAKLKVE